LLREARHVEHRDTLPLDVRGHPEERPDGDDTGAADARHENAVGTIDLGNRRMRERRRDRFPRRGLPLPELPALDRDEARAEPLHAGVILVARALVDRALAAELRL